MGTYYYHYLPLNKHAACMGHCQKQKKKNKTACIAWVTFGGGRGYLYLEKGKKILLDPGPNWERQDEPNMSHRPASGSAFSRGKYNYPYDGLH